MPKSPPSRRDRGSAKLNVEELRRTATDREQELNTARGTCWAVAKQMYAAHDAARRRAQATREKLALVDDAQRKLTESFKALSAEALKSNNQSFLDLARTSLEKFQESAKGDLDKRQQAIVELVKPVGSRWIKSTARSRSSKKLAKEPIKA